MHYPIRGVLTPQELAEVRAKLETGPFVDGRTTATGSAADVKRNLQIDADSPARRELAAIVGRALARNEDILALAFPKAMATPTFGRYDPGMEYGFHVDAPFLGGGTIRADISITLFLCDPDSYEGGELTLDQNGHETKIKMPAGDAYIYPTTYLHRVAPVTKGVRLVAVSWIQSHIPDERQRHIAIELSKVKRVLEAEQGMRTEADTLRGAVYNLMRLWWQT